MLRFLLLLLSVAAGGQTLASRPNPAADADSLSKAKIAMRQYLEDLTERTVVVRVTISEFKPDGSPAKIQHHEARHKGTHLRKTDEAFAPSMHVYKIDRRLMFFEFAHDATVWPAAIVLTAANFLDYSMNTATADSELRVHYQSGGRCVDFHADRDHMAASWCGSGDMIFDAATGMPKSVTFAAVGMPAELKHGKWILRAWRAEQSFQSLIPPGESNPIILPHALKTTFETDKGNIVIESVYALASEKK